MQEFISQISLWEGISEKGLEELTQMAILQPYSKNQLIFLQGEEGTGFFIVKSGRVKIFKISPEGKEQILQIFTKGQHFAEVPAFDGGVFPASALALEPTELLFFPRQSFLQFLEKYPQITINILTIFAQHLRRFTLLIEDLSLREVPARLAAYLLYFYESSQSSEIELEITKGQLAALLGTIPETLSRVFAKLSQEKIIMISGSRISLLNLPRLKALAGKN